MKVEGSQLWGGWQMTKSVEVPSAAVSTWGLLGICGTCTRQDMLPALNRHCSPRTSYLLIQKNEPWLDCKLFSHFSIWRLDQDRESIRPNIYQVLSFRTACISGMCWQKREYIHKVTVVMAGTISKVHYYPVKIFAFAIVSRNFVMWYIENMTWQLKNN